MIEIIDATDDNLFEMARVESASILYEEREDGYAPTADELVSLWSNRFLFGSHRAYLLVENGIAKGMMGMQLPHKKGIITALYIAPQYFRCGFGRRLIEKAVSLVSAAGGTQLVVEVQKHNFRALEFYKRLHFVETKVKFTHLIELKKELC